MGSGLEVAPSGVGGEQSVGVSMAQESWDKAGRKSHSGMLSGQGQVAWGGRINFLDGQPDAKPWGRGLGGAALLGPWGLSRPSPGQSLSRTCPQPHVLDVELSQRHGPQ